MAMTESVDRNGPMAGINVTPLADIMIVLLIIFMVAVSVIDQEDGLTLPPAQHAAKQEQREPLVVRVRQDASLSLGSDAVLDRTDLWTRLSARLAERPEGQRIVVVRAHEALPYTRVAEVLDACREAGAEEVALAALPKVEG
jgi:biopolymer transport protein ExbD